MGISDLIRDTFLDDEMMQFISIMTYSDIAEYSKKNNNNNWSKQIRSWTALKWLLWTSFC